MIDRQIIRDKFMVLLKTEMMMQGMSIRKLAKASGVSISAIVSYRNATRDVPLHKMIALAVSLGLPPIALVPEL